MGVGAAGARTPPPPHFERRGDEPPHFSNVHTFQYVLHNTKKSQNYCHAEGPEHSGSQKVIFLGKHAPRPP